MKEVTEYTNYETLEQDYLSGINLMNLYISMFITGKIHPGDLKAAVTGINLI